MRKRFFVGCIFISFLILLTGCSGGGGDTGFGLFSGDTSGEAGNATISGEVAGTVIVAINESDVQVARVTAAGTPKTFTLTVPTGHTYRFFLIENEDTLDQKIFPLYNNATGTNCFSISSVVSIDFGYVDTTNGVKALPENDPLLFSGVSSVGENKAIPEIVFSGPSPTGTLSDLVSNGLALLKQGAIFKAKSYFKAAVTNYPNDNTNDGDTARFFYAATRLAGINPYSDGNSAGTLNSVGDILDRMAINNSARNIHNYVTSDSKNTSPQTLPGNCPTGNELQTFLYNVIRPELEGALANLNGVNKEFEKQWANPIDSKYYISDYADVQLLKAAIKGALAGIHIQHTYNLDVDIDLEFNKYLNKTNTAQDFLSNNVDFLKPLTGDYSTSRSTAKTYLSEAADHFTAAVNKIQTRSTGVYLVNLDDSDKLSKTKEIIAAWKAALSGKSLITDYTDKSATIDLSYFFEKFELRNLLPNFTGNNAGYFPDKSMGGIIVSGLNPNEDLNSNGIPDILE